MRDDHQGGKGTGHPHAHFLILGLDQGAVRAMAEWMIDRLLARVPGFEFQEGQLAVFSRTAPWRRALSYVLKGSTPTARWPHHLLGETVLLLAQGRHLLSFYGLAKRPGGWARPHQADPSLEMAS